MVTQRNSQLTGEMINNIIASVSRLVAIQEHGNSDFFYLSPLATCQMICINGQEMLKGGGNVCFQLIQFVWLLNVSLVSMVSDRVDTDAHSAHQMSSECHLVSETRHHSAHVHTSEKPIFMYLTIHTLLWLVLLMILAGQIILTKSLLEFRLFLPTSQLYSSSTSLQRLEAFQSEEVGFIKWCKVEYCREKFQDPWYTIIC